MNECEEMKVTCIEPDQQALVTLANIEYRISVHMQGTYREILAVGRCLVEAKEAGLVPHGQWEEWVRRNTGMSERQAQRLMQAARNVQTGSAMESLPISKIQVISGARARGHGRAGSQRRHEPARTARGSTQAKAACG